MVNIYVTVVAVVVVVNIIVVAVGNMMMMTKMKMLKDIDNYFVENMNSFDHCCLLLSLLNFITPH